MDSTSTIFYPKKTAALAPCKTWSISTKSPRPAAKRNTQSAPGRVHEALPTCKLTCLHAIPLDVRHTETRRCATQAQADFPLRCPLLHKQNPLASPSPAKCPSRLSQFCPVTAGRQRKAHRHAPRCALPKRSGPSLPPSSVPMAPCAAASPPFLTPRVVRAVVESSGDSHRDRLLLEPPERAQAPLSPPLSGSAITRSHQTKDSRLVSAHKEIESNTALHLTLQRVMWVRLSIGKDLSSWKKPHGSLEEQITQTSSTTLRYWGVSSDGDVNSIAAKPQE